MGSATATTPAILLSTATYIAVLPSDASACTWPSRPPVLIPSRSINRRLPISTRRPSTRASIPWPGTESNFSGARTSMPRPAAPATIASARGCRDGRSADAARRSNSASMNPSAVMTSVSAGLPCVRVPVLSKITVSIPAVSSSAVAFLNNTPSRAPLPTPTVMAVGVASASASGHAMTIVETAAVNANSKPSPPKTYQATKATTPDPSATKTRYFPALSARRWAGALLACAF